MLRVSCFLPVRATRSDVICCMHAGKGFVFFGYYFKFLLQVIAISVPQTLFFFFAWM